MLWIEFSNGSQLDWNATHSVLFWGLDVSSGSTNTELFTNRNSRAKIQFYDVNISDSITSPDVQIYGFKAKNLFSDLNKHLSNPPGSEYNVRNHIKPLDRLKRETTEGGGSPGADFSDEDISVYPNPTSSVVNVQVKKKGVGNMEVNLNLINPSGTSVYKGVM